MTFTILFQNLSVHLIIGESLHFLNVVYFINVIDDKDLNFRKLHQYLPQRKVNWSEMKKNNDLYSFLYLRFLLGRSLPYKWIWREFNAEVSCNIVKYDQSVSNSFKSIKIGLYSIFNFKKCMSHFKTRVEKEKEGFILIFYTYLSESE